MENIESFSDDQLRKSLIQHGFENLPVTDTTRKVLVKKLQRAIEGQAVANRRETIAVSKFSSDEDVEEKAVRKSKSDKVANRRATVAAHPITKTFNGTSTKEATSGQATTSRRSSRATPVKDKPSASSTVYSVPDDSDEEPLRRPRTTTPTLGNSQTVRTSYKTNVADVVEELDSDEDSYEQEAHAEAKRAIRKPSPAITQSATRRKTFTASSNFTTESTPPPKFGRSSITTSFNPRGDYKFSEPSEDDLEINESNAPYLSSFAKRLSNLRAEPLDPGMDKYKGLRSTAPSTSAVYKSTQPTNFNYKFSAPTPPASKRGTIAQYFDSLDRRYNFRTTLYVVMIIMIVVAIYVIFM